MSLPPREVSRRLDQQAHDIEDAYLLLTELRTETVGGFARVDERLDQITEQLAQVEPQFAQFGGRLDSVDGRLDSVDARLDSVDGRLDSVDGRLDGHGQLLERILRLLDKPGT